MKAPFAMRLLHFRRTFVEKMFAIHGKVEALKRDGRPLGSYARHYYDLFQLAAAGSRDRHAEIRRVRRHQDRLRPDQPHPLLAQLFPSRKGCALPAATRYFRRRIWRRQSAPRMTPNVSCSVLVRIPHGGKFRTGC